MDGAYGNKYAKKFFLYTLCPIFAEYNFDKLISK